MTIPSHLKDLDHLTAMYSIAGRIALGAKAKTRKAELMEGKTAIVFNTLDEEIVPSLPPDLQTQLAHLDPREAIWASRISPGHFRCWARLDLVENELGRWVYFEAKMPPALLRFPQSKSCLAFTRVLVGAYALGRSINPEAKPALDKELAAMLSPGKWRVPPSP